MLKIICAIITHPRTLAALAALIALICSVAHDGSIPEPVMRALEALASALFGPAP